MKTVLVLLWLAFLGAGLLVWQFGGADAGTQALRLALFTAVLIGPATFTKVSAPGRLLAIAAAVMMAAAALTAAGHAWNLFAVDLRIAGELEGAAWVATAATLFFASPGEKWTPARVAQVLSTLLFCVAFGLRSAHTFGLAVPGAAYWQLALMSALLVSFVFGWAGREARPASEPRAKPMVLP